MAWGTWPLGTQATLTIAHWPSGPFSAVSIEGVTGVDLDALLLSPFTRGLVEIGQDNHLVAVGSTPPFPMLPAWRKTLRQIG